MLITALIIATIAMLRRRFRKPGAEGNNSRLRPALLPVLTSLAAVVIATVAITAVTHCYLV
jgi:hypothetical protein